MKKAMLMLVLLATGVSLAGCIVAPYPGYGYYRGGGCYYHRCW